MKETSYNKKGTLDIGVSSTSYYVVVPNKLLLGTFFYINRSHYYMNPFVIILGSIVYIILLSKLYRYIIIYEPINKITPNIPNK